MADSRKSQSGKGSSSFMDLITGKLGKIGALIVALSAVLGGVEKLFDVSSNIAAIFGGEEKVVAPTGLKDCFEAELSYPDEVSFDEWSSMELKMLGENKCAENLHGHVAFQTLGGTTLRIKPFKKGCSELAEPDCWEPITFDKGKPVDYPVMVPDLDRLGALSREVEVNIFWYVYAESKSIRSGKATITVRADQTVDDAAEAV